ncbi:MAG: CRISPR-associated protein Cas4 [Sedimentibacter sp.]
MNVNGTLINYYFHCKRQCYLHGNRLNFENDSEDVHIGQVLHEINNQGEDSEISIDNIKLDKLTAEYVIELKKSDADTEASKWQLLYYLNVLKDKGLVRKGKLIFDEKNKQSKKAIVVELTKNDIDQLHNLINAIDALINQNKVPIIEKSIKCKKCAYFEYCFI